MIDLGLLVLVLTAAAAGGLLCLRVVGALPADEADWLVAGVAAGFGVAATASLGLAALDALRPVPIACVGVVVVALGRRILVRALRAVDGRRLGAAWPLLLVCAAVLAAEAIAMVAPPVGGDQTKYQLAYPRLYAAAGGLVPTPWSFWGQMQFLQNFLFAIGFALSDGALARYLNGAFGVLTALALGALTRRHLGEESGPAAAALFFTLPITWSMMTHAGSDMPVVLYGCLALGALLDWTETGRSADVRRAGLMAGLAGASKVMGLLVPALTGGALLVLLLRRALPLRRAAALVAGFAVVAVLAATPCYVRNAVDTGNPIYPFGFQVFGGRHWSAAASEYLADYYRQYQSTYATRRDGEPYAGLAVVRFPWDLTMHPESFENAARATLDVSPFMLAFAPALLLVRRRRPKVLAAAGLGFAYAAIISTGAWAHPRYVLPGVALLLAATVPAAPLLLGRRLAAVVVALTIAGNLALVSRYLGTMWPDQLRVAVGRLAPGDFLRRYSPRYAFWERANVAVPPAGRVLVLEKIPHPYYIERSFVLGSYLEQGLIDYRAIESTAALADAARNLGVSHVAVDLSSLSAAGDPFEASVGRLWRGFIAAECDPVLREGEYGLYVLHAARAAARGAERLDG